jgi:hypothetical protein
VKANHLCTQALDLRSQLTRSFKAKDRNILVAPLPLAHKVDDNALESATVKRENDVDNPN